jgi:hypothetical protein
VILGEGLIAGLVVVCYTIGCGMGHLAWKNSMVAQNTHHHHHSQCIHHPQIGHLVS